MMVSPRTDTGCPCDAALVRHSEFWRLMDEEFGAGYARTVARDQVVAALGGRTAEQALSAHVPPRDVWVALCDAMDVPESRRWGRQPNLRAPR
jgi:hypothetical protein